MKEKTPTTQNQIKSSIESVLRPWRKLNENGQSVARIPSITVLEVARKTDVSPQRVLSELPPVINLNGSTLRVKREGEANIRIKKLIRESVREPSIKGVRNGRKRLNEDLLKRKIKQAKTERERLIFQAVAPKNANAARTKKRLTIHARIAERFARKIQTQNDTVVVRESDLNLQILRSLVPVKTNDIQTIAQNALSNPDIYVFDFLQMLGLSPQVVAQLKENANLLEMVSPLTRIKARGELKRIIDEIPVMHLLSKERVHPSTPFEEGVPLFFGMGGGSRMPCQGLPLDTLKMVLTGEKLRGRLGLSHCFVLGADVITYTNIGNSPEFTKEKVDQVIGTEVAILNEVFRRFGFKKWKAIRQSELSDHFPSEKVERWRKNIEEADKVDFVGGHHYSIEMSDIQLLVPNGIKLGWWIRKLSKDTGYIMDEQPFHARFALVMALLGKAHATTLLYTHAGSRILLGEDGLLQKEAPYITYTPHRRLLLSPSEDIARKLEWAERRGGGLTIPFVHEQMTGLVSLFEELVEPLPSVGKTANEVLAKKLQQIVDQGIGKDVNLVKRWKEAFPNSL